VAVVREKLVQAFGAGYRNIQHQQTLGESERLRARKTLGSSLIVADGPHLAGAPCA
jgi:hypothetical protein